MKHTLTENMREWLKELYLNEAEEHRTAANNCHVWALGSPTQEGATQWTEYEHEHMEFAKTLEVMAKELDG